MKLLPLKNHWNLPKMATEKFPMLDRSPSYNFTQYIVLPFKIGYVHIIITTVWLSISVGRGTGDSRVTV